MHSGTEVPRRGGVRCGVRLRWSGAEHLCHAHRPARALRGIQAARVLPGRPAYRAEAGGRCLIRLHNHGRGQGELEVSFEGETLAPVRQGFLEFVADHLAAKSTPGSVTKRHAYHCASAKCRNPFEDRVVKARLAARRKTLFCPICEKKTPLVDLLAAPTAAAESVAAQMNTDAHAGRQRMTAALVI